MNVLSPCNHFILFYFKLIMLVIFFCRVICFDNGAKPNYGKLVTTSCKRQKSTLCSANTFCYNTTVFYPRDLTNIWTLNSEIILGAITVFLPSKLSMIVDYLARCLMREDTYR